MKYLHKQLFCYNYVGSLSIYTDTECRMWGKLIDLQSSVCDDSIFILLCKSSIRYNVLSVARLTLLTTAAVVRTHAVVYARVTAGICMYSWVTLFAIIFIRRINKLFNTLSLCIRTVTYPTTHFSRLTLTNDRTVHCGWALCSRSISTLSVSFRLFISNGSKCLRLDIRVLMGAEFVASAPPRGYKQNHRHNKYLDASLAVGSYVNVAAILVRATFPSFS